MITYIGENADPNHQYQNILGKALYKEIIHDDSYYLRKFFSTNKLPINHIIDIGANIGYFTLLASVLYPETEKILIEPNPENVKVLNFNFKDFSNINIIPKALGDGSKVKMSFDSRWSGSDTVLISNDGNIESINPNKIITKDLNNFILKVDCEGGEKYLKELDKSFFKNCLYFTCEFHESSDNKIEDWENWLVNTFSNYTIHKKFLGEDTFPLYMYYIIKNNPQFTI